VRRRPRCLVVLPCVCADENTFDWEPNLALSVCPISNTTHCFRPCVDRGAHSGTEPDSALCLRMESKSTEDADKGDIRAAKATGPALGEVAVSKEEFTCAVCLELLYNPCTPKCGHVLCYWCLHKSMNPWGESLCCICRTPFEHQPHPTEGLAAFIRNRFPSEYAERERDTKNEMSEECVVIVPHRESGKEFNCELCGSWLWKPRVLNCGHMFCDYCAHSMQECCACGERVVAKPSTCHFVESLMSRFHADEYPARQSVAARVWEKIAREEQQAAASVDEQGQGSHVAEPLGGGGQEETVKSDTPQDGNAELMVHPSVGCDWCGMYPIRGKRFQCQDCPSQYGFDLCEECHSRPFQEIQGRFNQHHTADHRMVEKTGISPQRDGLTVRDLRVRDFFRLWEVLRQDSSRSNRAVEEIVNSPSFPGSARDMAALYEELQDFNEAFASTMARPGATVSQSHSRSQRQSLS